MELLLYGTNRSPRPRSRKQNAVYIVKDGGNGVFKIGKTDCFEKRFRTYKTHNPFCEPVACVSVNGDAGDVEKLLHKRFDEYRITGEWFSVKALKAAKKELLSYSKKKRV